VTFAFAPVRLSRYLLALLLASGPAGALAQTGFSASLVSDYRYRGMSLSDGLPVAQLAVNHDTASGAYFGLAVSGARLRYAETNAQAVAYAGYAGRLGAAFSWEAGFSATAFSRAARYGYREAYVGIGVERLSARVYLAPNYFGIGGRALYTELNGSYPLSAKVDLVAHAGHLRAAERNEYRPFAPDPYTDLQAGLSAVHDNWTTQLTWGTTRGDASDARVYGSRAHRWVLSGARAF
jgi:uncharacterized protein (TIGR02001 family)